MTSINKKRRKLYCSIAAGYNNILIFHEKLIHVQRNYRHLSHQQHQSSQLSHLSLQKHRTLRVPSSLSRKLNCSISQPYLRQHRNIEQNLYLYKDLSEAPST